MGGLSALNRFSRVFPRKLFCLLRFAVMIVFALAMAQFSVAADGSGITDDGFRGLIEAEAENFRQAFGLDAPFEVSGFERSSIGDYSVFKFAVSGKNLKVVSLNDVADFKKELRKVFSAELGSLAGESESYVYDAYKNIVTAKGNMSVADLLVMRSLDGTRGTYIVNQKGSFEEEMPDGEKKRSEIYFLKPLKACHVFNNARLERKKLHLMADVTYGLSFFNSMGHVVSAGIKFTKTYPVYLNLGLVYGLRPGALNAIGIRPGVESFVSMDSLFGSRTGLGIFVGFNFSLLYDFQSMAMAYAPDVELGIRWFFDSEWALSAGARFVTEFTKNASASGGLSGKFGICAIVGFTMIL